MGKSMRSSSTFNRLFFDVNKLVIEMIKEALKNSDHIALEQLNISVEQAKYIASLDSGHYKKLYELGGLLVNITINADTLNIVKENINNNKNK
jgi:hypothetical protein